jgi:hypothetical protein
MSSSSAMVAVARLRGVAEDRIWKPSSRVDYTLLDPRVCLDCFPFQSSGVSCARPLSMRMAFLQ